MILSGFALDEMCDDEHYTLQGFLVCWNHYSCPFDPSCLECYWLWHVRQVEVGLREPDFVEHVCRGFLWVPFGLTLLALGLFFRRFFLS